MKPVIGITTFCEIKQGNKIYDEVNYNYIKSISIAGGVPFLIPVTANDIDIGSYLDIIDGVMFTGGNDISPVLYGEEPIKEVVSISEDRDSYEFALYKEAFKRNMPVLGICRGIQLINAASGGTLYQDIYSELKDIKGHYQSDTPSDNLYHSVDISKGSKLYNIFGSEKILVNSFHHQSVKKVADGFKITAKASDGIIEAIENIHKDFIVGVQWHPEGLVEKHPQFIKLFEAFINAAGNYKKCISK